MPYGYGSSSGGGGPAGGASSGGNYGGGGPPSQGGGGGQAAAQAANAQRAVQQAAAQRAMQAQIAQAEAQQAAKEKTAAETQTRMSGIGPRASQSKGVGETLKSGFPIAETLMNVASPAINFGRGLLGFQDPVATPSMKQDLIDRAIAKGGDTGSLGYEDFGLDASAGRFTGGLFGLVNDPAAFGNVGSTGRVSYGIDPETGEMGFGDTKYDFTPDPDTGSTGSAILDFINEGGVKGKLANLNLMGTAQAATPGYQNIFQTGAVSQTPGGAYQPPAPAGTGEGLGSIAGPIQGLINQPKIAGPIQGLIGQPKAAPVTTGEGKVAGPMDYLQPKAPVINPFEQPGARTAIPRPPVRSRIQDDRAEDIRKKALGNIALQTDKSLTDIYDAPKQGIMSSLLGTGKNIAGNMAKQFAINKLGLGFLNPFLGLASLFGKGKWKDPIGSLMAKLPKGTGTKTAWQPDRGGGDGQGQGQGQAPANVIQAGMQQFQPTDQQTSQMDEIRRKMLILQGYADKGSLNERGMSTLAQMNQMISQYQADPRSIYG